MPLFLAAFYATRIRFLYHDAGPTGSGQIMRIRPDPDPQHWLYVVSAEPGVESSRLWIRWIYSQRSWPSQPPTGRLIN